MSAAPALEEGAIHVWRGSLDQVPEVQPWLEAFLSRDERERAERFRFDRDRTRYVVARGLLRLLLGRYVGIDPEELRFGYGRYGKPALLGDGPHFNLAHSGTAALYAFSACSELGVDIELVRPELTGGGIAERFFSPREVRTLRALPEEDQAHAFFACWTRKEAFVKARGDGLTLALDSFDVTLAPDEPAALLRTGWSSDEHSRWRLADLSDIERQQVAALAAPATGWHYICRDIDITTVVFN